MGTFTSVSDNRQVLTALGALIETGITAIIAILSVVISLICTLPASITMIFISAVTLNNLTGLKMALSGP